MKTSNRIVAITVAVIVLLLSLVFALLTKVSRQQEEIDRDERNIEVLEGEQSDYLIKDSVRVAEIGALETEQKEWGKKNEELQKLVNSLRNAKKNKAEYITSAIVNDTIWLKETAKDTVYLNKDTCISITDAYCQYMRCGDDVKFCTVDTIVQVISKHYRHKFLWIKWGYDGVRQDVISKNPNSRITFDQFLKFE